MWSVSVVSQCGQLVWSVTGQLVWSVTGQLVWSVTGQSVWSVSVWSVGVVVVRHIHAGFVDNNFWGRRRVFITREFSPDRSVL